MNQPAYSKPKNSLPRPEKANCGGRAIAIAFSLVAAVFPFDGHAETRKIYVDHWKLWFNRVTNAYQVDVESAVDDKVQQFVSRLEEPYYVKSISAMECVAHDNLDGIGKHYVDKGPSACQKFVITGRRDQPSFEARNGEGSSASLFCPEGAQPIPIENRGYLDGVNHDLQCYFEEEITTPNTCAGPKAGNPIDVFSGRKEESIELLRDPIPIRLHYNSQAGWSPSFSETLTDRNSDKDWLSKWDCIPGTASGTTLSRCFRRLGFAERTGHTPWQLDMTYRGGDGSFAEFSASGKSPTIGSGAILDIRDGTPLKYVVRLDETEKIFDTYGRLVSIAQRDGSGQLFTYLNATGEKQHANSPTCRFTTSGSALPGQPSCVTDARTGRQINFVYSEEGLSRVIDPNGAAIEIAYNGPRAVVRSAPRRLNLVTSIKYPDGKQVFFSYNEEDHMNGGDFPHALTSKSNLAGNKFADFYYGPSGRAVLSQHVNGIGRVEIPEPCYGCDDYTITQPDGSASKVYKTYFYYSLGEGHRGASPMATQNLQPAGAGCAAAADHISYTPSGLISELIDLNGNKTCYSVDELTEREAFRIEGMGRYDSCYTAINGALPANTRRISTKWHPRWKLPVQVAAPNRISTYVYNGQPDPLNGNAIANCVATGGTLPDGAPIAALCRQVDQATTDLTGAQAFAAVPQSGTSTRARSWTYDSSGRVLTATDPRGNVVLRNEYYLVDSSDFRAGDLKSTKNSLGQTTTYSKYTADGKVLEQIDPNGLLTSFVYDSNQRVVSSAVNGKSTTYQYSPEGLLQRTTQPDGSYQTFEYDAGHRLIAMADSEGNRIVYTLDASGRRIREDFNDPAGSLRATAARTFDALGRLQQLTSQ